jgi:hypothetical protein
MKKKKHRQNNLGRFLLLLNHERHEKHERKTKLSLKIREFMRGKTFSDDDKYQPVPQTQLDLQPGVLKQRPEYDE